MDNLTRRGMLIGVGATVAAGSVSFRTLPAFAASETSAIAHSPRVLFRYNADFSESIPWPAPGAVSLAGPILSADSRTLEVTWDARLASVLSQDVFAAYGGKAYQVRGRASTDGHVGTLRVSLSDLADLARGFRTWTLIPQINLVADFSETGLDTVVETSVQIVGDKSRSAPLVAPRLQSRDVSATQGAVWGGDVSVIWGGLVDGSAATRFSRPELVVVEAVGPGPVPAGARVVVCADAASVGTLSLDKATVNGSERLRVRQLLANPLGATAQLILLLQQPLPTGSQARFVLNSSRKGPNVPSQEARSACLVSLDSGELPPELQRSTGNEIRSLTD